MGRPARNRPIDIALMRAQFDIDPSKAAELAASAGYGVPYFKRVMRGHVHKAAGGPVAPSPKRAKPLGRVDKRKIFADAVEALHIYGELPPLVALNPGGSTPQKLRVLRIRKILERTRAIISTLWRDIERPADDPNACWRWSGRWIQRAPGAPRIPVLISIDGRNYIDARRLVAATRGRLFPKRGKLTLSCGNDCLNPDHVLTLTKGQRANNS